MKVDKVNSADGVYCYGKRKLGKMSKACHHGSVVKGGGGRDN